MEWISVKDAQPPVKYTYGHKLPSDLRRFNNDYPQKALYLVCVQKDGHRPKIKLGYWSPNVQNGTVKDTKWRVADYRHIEVTHWMPLPPPPDHFPDAGKMVDHIVSEDKKV